MSLTEAIGLIEPLAPKQAGHLIKHDNWNDFVAGVLSMAQELENTNTEVSALKEQVGTLAEALAAAQVQIDELITLKETVAPLLNQYIVTTRCDRLSYALGELCTITAEVTDLNGNPVAERPWVDFVASWGRLRPAGGFQSRGGEGDNSISVRTDSNGIARVILRSENNENLSESDELQIQGMLGTQVAGTSKNLAQVMLDEPAPTGGHVQAAFQMVSLEYEKAGNNLFKAFADNYQFRAPLKPTLPILPLPPLPGWRDYRATVMAFAKPDGDPTTPDNTRGGSTIQITFRDWLFNWIGDYVFNVGQLELDIADVVKPMWQLDNHLDILSNFQQYTQESIADAGVIGQFRFFNAQENALGNVAVPVADSFKTTLKEQVQTAIASQTKAGLFGGNGGEFLQTMLNSGKQASQVKTQVDGVQVEVQAQASVKDAVTVLEGRMQASETLGSRIETSINRVIDDVANINVLDESSIQVGIQKLNTEFALIKGNIKP